MVLTRRGFLAGTLATTACGRAPVIRSRAPEITHGVQSGDVQTTASGVTATVWARCNERARMLVEWDTSATFANPRRVAGPLVGPERDHTGTVALTGLPADQTISYRVRFEREANRGASTWTTGRLATPRRDRFRVAWTGDTCGQGFGRDPDFGGLQGYAALRAAEPQLFINSGDLIYADNPIEAEVRTPAGVIWRNITNERVARVAQSLDDFRARFAYNLEDDHLRTFAGEVSSIVQWDDHETHNDWWPGQQLADERYRERDASKLAAHALAAFHEWTPMAPGQVQRVIHYGPLLDVIVTDCRSFRSPNDRGTGTDSAMLGVNQTQWLIDALATSRARWKIVACDQPVALVIPDNDDHVEGFAAGAPEIGGREHEFARVLRGIAAVKNVVWVTADVHYAAAHHFDPSRSKADIPFAPFWEFIAGPIHAGTFGPNALDPTFGADLRFQRAPEAGKANLSPRDGLQFYGTIDVSPDALAVTLSSTDGKPVYKIDLAYDS